ncbi:MAG: AAA family ATPase [Kineosporiaceae bacterium]
MGTRAAKSHESWTREEQLDVWNARLQRVLAGSLTRVAEQHIALDAPAAREFSPEAVIAEAVAAAHGPEGEATLNRHELARRIHLALPAHVEGGPQARRDLLDALTDHAVERLVQVSGLEVGDVHQAGRLANGQAKTISPTSVRYAAPGQLAAEITLLNTAGRRGAACLNRRSAEAWITRHAPELSPAQREAVLGLAGSDAHLAVLVGAAGTGKTYTAGALDALWRDLTRQLPPPTPAPTNDTEAAEGAETATAAPIAVPGRVVGLSVTQAAADVLHQDGVADTANLTAFLAAQNALDAGRTVAGSPAGRWLLGPRDIVLVDEASMIDTAQLVRLHDVAERAGARLVLMGDPAQLGSVGAGGMMRAIVERDAETYTLSEVRRFEADWERAASLALREGEQDAVAAYDVHGRIRDGGTQQATIAALAQAAAADRISGRSSVVVTATNEQGATVAAAIRRHLVTAGLVEEGGVVLGRDQNTAGVGDLVQARRIDRALGLTNRETYQVAAVRDDGGLDVVNTRTGQACLMPADYVAADVALAYAATAHAAQGATVNTGHVLLTTQLDRAGAYVGLTRGRESNTAWAVTDTGIPDVPTTTGRGLLAAAIAPEDDLAAVDDEAAAVDVRQVDQLRRSSAQTLLGLIEDETRLACRQRLEGHLDTLHADGVLSEPERARLGADQGCEHLSRLLRTYEQAGHEPLDLLRGAIEQRSLAGTVSIAQTLAYRLHRDDVLPAPTRDGAPQGIAAAQEGYLGQLTGLLADRRHDLAEQVAATQPAWVTTALGPMPPEAPETSPARADWLERAGTLAAYREATGWDHDEIALGRCPGVHSPEKRAAWHAAYTAAGEPEQRRPEAELDTGRLLVRARAAELAAAHTPEAVFDAQREANLALADARRSAVLAHSRGDLEQAARHEADADHQARLAAALDAQTEARGMHLAYHAETFAAGQAAEEELRRRGVARGAEPDRTSATEWLAAEHRARVEDDAHRLITEADLTDHADQTGLSESADLADAAARNDAADPTADLDVDDVHEPAHLPTAEPVASEQVPDVDRTEVAEAASQAETTESDAAETVTAAAPVDEEVSARSASAQLVEIEAAAAAAHAAMDEVADHTSQDAAHAETDDWDYSAGPDYAPAPDTGDELARDHTVTDETGSQAYEPVAEAGISE